MFKNKEMIYYLGFIPVILLLGWLSTGERDNIEDKKRWTAIVYCENCKEVNSISIPPNVLLEEGDCVTCRVRGKLKFVSKVNF